MTSLADMPITQLALVPPQGARVDSVGGEDLRRVADLMIDLHPGELIWRRTFLNTPDQVPLARHFVRYLLADAWCRDDAELIVAELARNALQHTASGGERGSFTVEVTRTIETVAVAVYDSGWGGFPQFSADAREGRGLGIVAAIADAVGFDGIDGEGHKVWARLRRTPPPAADTPLPRPRPRT